MLGAMFGLGFILGPVMGGLLGAIDLRLPFFAAGSLALRQPALRLVRAARVAAARMRRRDFDWKSRQPGRARCASSAQLQGRRACWSRWSPAAALAQFVLYTSWVLYTTFKFGWGPLRERLVARSRSASCRRSCRALLLGRLLKRFSAAAAGGARAAVVDARLRCCGAPPTEGWMMFAVIFVNLLGATVAASIQSIISGAADARNAGPDAGRGRRG